MVVPQPEDTPATDRALKLPFYYVHRIWLHFQWLQVPMVIELQTKYKEYRMNLKTELNLTATGP